MRHAQELQLERRQVDRPARRHDVQLHLIEQLHLGQLAAQHRGGERRGIDRAAQLRPQPGHRADMVLVRVGDDQAHQLVAAIGDVAGVGIITSTSGCAAPPKPMPQSTASHLPSQR